MKAYCDLENNQTFYNDLEDESIYRAHLEGSYHPTFSAIADVSARDLIQKMLSKYPPLRISAGDALKHGFFKKKIVSPRKSEDEEGENGKVCVYYKTELLTLLLEDSETISSLH